MLSVDKKVMEASYSRGGLDTQKKMVKFYTAGMQGISTASLIAMHNVMASSRKNIDPERSTYVRLYLFYGLMTAVMVFSILAVNITNMCTSFGAVEFLCGQNALDVHNSVRQMRKKSVEGLQFFLLARLCFLLQCWTWCLDSGNIPVIVTECVVFSVGLAAMVRYHFISLRLFTSDSNEDPLVFVTSLFAEYGGDVKTSNEAKSKALQLHQASSLPTSAPGGPRASEEGAEGRNSGDIGSVEERLTTLRQQCRRRLRGLSHRGVLWVRREEEQQSFFSKTYSVLEAGRLFFFRDQDEYESSLSRQEHGDKDRERERDKDGGGGDTDRHHSRQLLGVEMETSRRALEAQETPSSLRSAARKMIFGTSAFSLKDVMAADFDVEAAANQFQFCLSESSDSELDHRGRLFLLAQDQAAYREWTSVLREAIDCYRDLSNLVTANKSLALTHDPKAAVAFVHDSSTRRVVQQKEKARHREERIREEAIIQSIHSHNTSRPRSRSLLSLLSPGGVPSSGPSYSTEEVLRVERKMELKAQLAGIQCRGILWSKSLVVKEEPQAHFSKCYASLEHGKLSFFKTVDDFNELGNTFGGAAPLPLKHYKNKIKSSRLTMNAKKRLRAAVRGTSEMRIRDTLRCQFDYMNAVGNFQMCLVPRTGSKKADLTGLEAVVLMAEDRRSYDLWSDGLSAVIGVIEELEAIQALGNGKPPRGGVAAGASRFRLTLDAESAVTHSNLRSQSQPGVRL